MMRFSFGRAQRAPTEPNAWYNNREGLEARLKDGIDGLREIAWERQRAHYDRGETLTEWCILGRFQADSCGNFSKITEGAPADAMEFRSYEEPDLRPVMTMEEMGDFSGRWVATMRAALPPAYATCDRCGEGWTLRNVDNFIWLQRTEQARHQECHRIAIIEDEREHFEDILKKAEIPYTKLIAFPSQYYPDPDYFGPWFWVETPKGRIKIGWRKRVINIDWSKTALGATGGDIVEDPKVTHGHTYVHAWGPDKAVAALRRLWGLPALEELKE